MERKTNFEEIIGAFIGILLVITLATYFLVNNHINNIKKEYELSISELNTEMIKGEKDFRVTLGNILERNLEEKRIFYFNCSILETKTLIENCNFRNQSVKFYEDNPSELN